MCSPRYNLPPKSFFEASICPTSSSSSSSHRHYHNFDTRAVRPLIINCAYSVRRRNPPLPPQIPQPKNGGANSKLDKTWDKVAARQTGHSATASFATAIVCERATFTHISHFAARPDDAEDKGMGPRVSGRCGGMGSALPAIHPMATARTQVDQAAPDRRRLRATISVPHFREVPSFLRMKTL